MTMINREQFTIRRDNNFVQFYFSINTKYAHAHRWFRLLLF